MGHNNNSTMLHSVEAATLSADTAIATANEQHEPDMHRLAFGSEIPTRSLAALKEHFSSMAGELCDATNYFNLKLFYAVPQISENVRSNGEEPNERESHREHTLQGQKGFLCEEVATTCTNIDLCLFILNHFSIRSVSHPFLGDYVRLRQNVQWKKICVENNDQYVVFADIINKIARSSGKVMRKSILILTTNSLSLIFQFVPILLVLSTSSMLLLDQRTLQIKYRVPASEIYRMSLSPFLDDIAVFHVKAVSKMKNILS